MSFVEAAWLDKRRISVLLKQHGLTNVEYQFY